jgi:hypothetical protein
MLVISTSFMSKSVAVRAWRFFPGKFDFIDDLLLGTGEGRIDIDILLIGARQTHAHEHGRTVGSPAHIYTGRNTNYSVRIARKMAFDIESGIAGCLGKREKPQSRTENYDRMTDYGHV